MTTKDILVIMYCTVVGVLIMLGGIVIGIMYSNTTTKQALRDVADDLLTNCEEDGLQGCHVEWKYKDGVIFGVTSVGKGESK